MKTVNHQKTDPDTNIEQCGDKEVKLSFKSRKLDRTMIIILLKNRKIFITDERKNIYINYVNKKAYVNWHFLQ